MNASSAKMPGSLAQLRVSYQQTQLRNDTKKRRMLCIVVSCLPAVSERLMLLDYQIGLDFASGVGSWNIGKIVSESARV